VWCRCGRIAIYEDRCEDCWAEDQAHYDDRVTRRARTEFGGVPSHVKTKNLVMDTNVIKAGDVVGFSGRSWLSAGINLATYGIPLWGISHVGIMAHADDGQLLIFESTSLDDLPCEISGKIFTGTQAHKLDDILRVYKGRVYHYPLYRPLYSAEDERLTQFLMDTIHTPYDMMGAMRSAGVGLSWFESLFRPQDLSTIFCSEWLASALSTIGVFPTSNASRWNPNKLTRYLRWNGVVCRARRLK